MSFEAMAWAVKQELPAMQKLVLLLLANRTNSDTGQCTPSHERLAKDCGMTSRAVKAQIAKLVEAGLLTITPRTKDGLSLPNQYTLVIGGQGGNHVPTRGNDIPPGGNDVPGGGEQRSYLGGNHVPTKQEDESVNESGSKTVGTASPAKFSPLAHLKEMGVDEQVASDWLQTRKAKKSPATKTAIDGVLESLAAAGYQPNDGIKLCCKRGWAGFDPSWLGNQGQNRQQSAYQTAQEKQKSLADRLTGNAHAHRPDIIDIN